MERTFDLVEKCAKCGSCTQVCPVYLETGRESHSARGKLHLFTKETDYSSEYFNSILAKCIQCGACDAICPRNLEPSLIIRALRSGQSTSQTTKGYLSYVTRHILQTKALLKASSTSLPLLKNLPLSSGLRQKINTITTHENSPIPTPKSASKKELLYYPGCLAHHFQTDIEHATRYLASLCDYSLTIPKQATCCGIASSSSGKTDEARHQALKNIQAYSQSSGPILTSCGSCYTQLKSYPTLFAENSEEQRTAHNFAKRVQEFSTFFLKENKLISQKEAQRVYYHDPCHLRFGQHPITNEPRHLIRNINHQAVVNQDEPLGCCGQGGLFELVNPEISAGIFARVKGKIAEAPHTTVVTTCSSCLMAWQRNTQGTAITSLHLSVFLAKKCRNC